MSEHPRFHLAFPVVDLAQTREFYVGLLGCAEGRSTRDWVDFNLWGHQVVAHLAPEECVPPGQSLVDGKAVPVRHFGVILEWGPWQALAAKLKDAKIDFVIEPYIRFAGKPGEQATMFFHDPSGNALEFKAFRNDAQIFAT
jgi:uncharacterized protein